MADEVGLGKTIEAGLVLNYVLDSGAKKDAYFPSCDIAEAWEIELLEKFGLHSVILDRYTVEHDTSNIQHQLENREKVSIVLTSYDYSSN